MKSKRNIVLSLICLLVSSASINGESLLKYVDPFIGTGAHGHTFPGAAVPFGAVQVSPDTRNRGWDACGGYHYSDSSIMGFSQTHFSGTGCGDLGDLLFMPRVGKVILDPGTPEEPDSGYRSRFSHDSEIASPGYYKVNLDDYDIKTEITATQRAGLYRFTFPEAKDAHILFDLTHKIEFKSYHNKEIRIKVENDQFITGYKRIGGWAKNRHLYFAARFSKPFSSHTLYDGDNSSSKTELSSTSLKSLFHFNTRKDEEILMKISISSVSVENATENLDKEVPGWEFEKIKTAAADMWNKALGKIDAQADERTLKIFYTALYHTMILPATFSDLNGEYLGLDQKVHKAEGWTSYHIFSTWDTFRGLHPLHTIIEQDRVNDIVHSMLAHYEQNSNKMLPIWSFGSSETGCMIGYHSVPIIADAVLKNLTDIDKEKVLEAFISTSTQEDHEGLGYYIKNGYVPGEEGFKFTEGASKTLAYAYDDWCIAQVARSMSKNDVYETYRARSQNYRNVFDKTTGFIRAKQVDGEWRKPFHPVACKRPGKKGKDRDYTEGNAWQWSWFVPHDVDGMIGLYDGNQNFITRLDALFTDDEAVRDKYIPNEPAPAEKVETKGKKKKRRNIGSYGPELLSDVTGLVGMYAHGNEPSHHVAHLYSYAGAPWKTQEILNRIMTEHYTDKPDGIPGNEDCGQMSAWYVLNAMGFYSVNPCGGVYVIGKPMLVSAKINMENGKTFAITANNLDGKNIYIQSVKLNGEDHNRIWLTYDDIINGGSLTFEMGPEPNKAWGTKELNVPLSDGK